MPSSTDLTPIMPCGARPDAETPEALYLIKPVSQLRATYQIRLLAFAASQRGRRLILTVPKACRFAPDLEALMARWPATLERRDLP
jgi:hypothetical protein